MSMHSSISLKSELVELLKEGAALDPTIIPDAIRNQPIRNLDIPIRVCSLMETMNIKTVWDLVRANESNLLRHRSLASSSVRLTEFIKAINLSLSLLKGSNS